MAAAAGHRIRWFVYGCNSDGKGGRIPHNAHMRGTWGWDAVCSCGWDSKTGGALRRSVEANVWMHKQGLA